MPLGPTTGCVIIEHRTTICAKGSAETELEPRFGGRFSSREKESETPAFKPPYAAEFCEQMVELARAGRGLKQLSREFGVSANAIRNWVQRARGQVPRPQPRAVVAVPLNSSSCVSG